MENILCKVFRLSNTTNRCRKNYLSCNRSNILRANVPTWLWYSGRSFFAEQFYWFVDFSPNRNLPAKYSAWWSNCRIRGCPVFDSRGLRIFSRRAIPEHGDQSLCRSEFESRTYNNNFILGGMRTGAGKMWWAGRGAQRQVLRVYNSKTGVRSTRARPNPTNKDIRVCTLLSMARFPNV
jgi:hypothetical protein